MTAGFRRMALLTGVSAMALGIAWRPRSPAAPVDPYAEALIGDIRLVDAQFVEDPRP